MTIRANSKYTAFRIPISHIEALEEHAKKLGLTVNALVGIIIKGVLNGTIDVTKRGPNTQNIEHGIDT